MSSLNPRAYGLDNRYNNFSTPNGCKFTHRYTTSAGVTFVRSKVLKVSNSKELYCRTTRQGVLRHNRSVRNFCYIPNIGGRSDEAPLYLGQYPKRVGIIPGKVVFPRDFSAVYFSSEMCPKRYRVKIGMDRVLATGSFDTNQYSVREYGLIAKKRVRSFELENAVNRCTVKYRFHRAMTPTEFDYFFMRIRPSSGCGGDTQNYFPNKLKGFNSCFKAALELKRLIEKNKNFTPNHSIYTLGGRDKRSKVLTGDGSQILSRHVIQQDFVEYILAKPWVSKIEDALSVDPLFPIFLKHSNSKFGWLKILRQMSIYNGTSIEADWSLFDTTTIKSAIIQAFSLCRGLFPESKKIDKLFFYFCDGFVNKHILMPDGKLFQFQKGTPSGSVWTTVINGLVNLILLEHIIFKYNKQTIGRTDFRVMVAGDDTVINYCKYIKFDKDKFESFCKAEVGMTLKVEKKGAFYNRNEDKCISFLKTCFWFDTSLGMLVPTTRGEDVAKRLYCPQKLLNTDKKLVDYVLAQPDLLLNAPYAREVTKGFCLSSWAGLNIYSDDKVIDNIYKISEMLILNKQQEIYFNKYIDPFTKQGENNTIKPYLEDSFVDDKYDNIYIKNWIYDNTIFDYGGGINTIERYEWLVKQTGFKGNYLVVLENHIKRLDLWRLSNNLADFYKLTRFWNQYKSEALRVIDLINTKRINV